jgi:hypothetical protein
MKIFNIYGDKKQFFNNHMGKSKLLKKMYKKMPKKIRKKYIFVEREKLICQHQ